MLLVSLDDLHQQLQHNSTSLETALKDADKVMQALRKKMATTDAEEKEVLKAQQESEGQVNGLREKFAEKENQLSTVKQQEEQVKSHATEMAMQVKKGRYDEKTEFHKLKETASEVRSLQKE